MMTGGPGGPSTLVSTSQLESPLVTKPRARIVVLVGRESPASCQPPGMRSPAPRLNQAPLVAASKVVRQTSGLAPPRSQVILVPSKTRLAFAGIELFNRPMFVRD